MSGCLFCKIINGEISSKKVYEDDKVYAFEDVNPQAPIHFLVVPKEHISSALELNDSNKDVVGHVFTVVSEIAAKMGFDKNGFRIVNNCGKDGGQTVGHLHFHVLAGRNIGWPPG